MTEEDIDKGERKRALLKMNTEKGNCSRKKGREKERTKHRMKNKKIQNVRFEQK